jgi:RpiB/LacA/LacB family sugar-phosphate isomerase
MKTLVIGSDHAGFCLKEVLKGSLRQDFRVIDVGTDSEEAVDYPDFARKVAEAVVTGKAERGILICGSGVGACVAANKIQGIRAGLCHDTYSAHQGVEHDQMNVLVLGSRVIGEALARELVVAFLAAEFSGEERHVRRLAKIRDIETGSALQPREPGSGAARG